MSSNINLFHKLYDENLLRVDWSKEDLGLAISRSINEEEKKLINEAVINDFMEYVTVIMEYVTKKEYEKPSIFYELKNIMGEDFDKIILEAERNVVVTGPTLDSLDIEYLTKRSYRDIRNIIGYNTKVKFNLSDKSEFHIELDEYQLMTLSESLSLALEDLKSLKK